MKRNMLLTAITVATFGLPLGQVVLAGDFRDRDDTRRHDDDDDGYRRARFVVRYHLDGGERTIHAQDREWAYRKVNFLQKMGAEAHVDGRHVVHFEMRGRRARVVCSDAEAHELVERLRNYGFHAQVDHD
jgi:hypothetical protein